MYLENYHSLSFANSHNLGIKVIPINNPPIGNIAFKLHSFLLDFSFFL